MNNKILCGKQGNHGHNDFPRLRTRVTSLLHSTIKKGGLSSEIPAFFITA